MRGDQFIGDACLPSQLAKAPIGTVRRVMCVLDHSKFPADINSSEPCSSSAAHHHRSEGGPRSAAAVACAASRSDKPALAQSELRSFDLLGRLRLPPLVAPSGRATS